MKKEEKIKSLLEINEPIETSEEKSLDKSQEETPATEPNEEVVEEEDAKDIVDIDLDAKKQMVILERFRIAHDNNRIIELNTRDINVVKRLDEAYNNIQDYLDKSTDIKTDEKDLTATLDILEGQEAYIRSQINYIFGTDVCTPILQDISVMSSKNGQYAFEWLITEVFKFYESAITKEAKKVQARVKKHTSKYW